MYPGNNYHIAHIKNPVLLRKRIAIATTDIENAYAGIDDVRQFLGGVENSILAISGNHIPI
jgi:hypothetical protein